MWHCCPICFGGTSHRWSTPFCCGRPARRFRSGNRNSNSTGIISSGTSSRTYQEHVEQEYECTLNPKPSHTRKLTRRRRWCLEVTISEPIAARSGCVLISQDVTDFGLLLHDRCCRFGWCVSIKSICAPLGSMAEQHRLINAFCNLCYWYSAW